MSVRRRKDRDNAYWIDVVEWIDGKMERVRERAPIQNKREAERYAHEVRQRLREKTYEPVVKREVPTFEAFSDNLKTYARTNNKPSEVDSKESILKNHLIPYF